jgi:hypothetical protein
MHRVPQPLPSRRASYRTAVTDRAAIVFPSLSGGALVIHFRRDAAEGLLRIALDDLAQERIGVGALAVEPIPGRDTEAARGILARAGWDGVRARLRAKNRGK